MDKREKDLDSLLKLTESNWPQWSVMFQWKLEYLGYSDVLEEDAPTEPAQKAEWTKRDKKVHALIGLNVASEYISLVQRAKTAKETWKSLEDLHCKTSMALIDRLESEWQDLRANGSENVMSYIARREHSGEAQSCRSGHKGQRCYQENSERTAFQLSISSGALLPYR